VRGAGLGACAVVLAACASPTFDFGERWPTPARGMVVSEHPLATRAGVEVLEKGGNAADAAVATALALAVVYPQAGNLGGGGFALWVAHDPEQPPTCLDFRETAPRNLRPSDFVDAAGNFVPSRSVESALGVGVPGSPAGLLAFHERHGKLSLRSVAAPALRLAREGFRLEPWLAEDLARPGLRSRLLRHGMAFQVFYRDEEPLAEGEFVVQPELAATIQRLVDDGARGFYEGEVADALVAAVRAGGGVLDHQDLRDYEPKWREPLRGWFRGLEILTVPPPSSGGIVLLQVLSMLDGFPLDEEAQQTRQRWIDEGRSFPGQAPLSPRAIHWWIEALRLAFADRAEHLGDPDFHDVPQQELLGADWILERRISIGELANPKVGPLQLEFHSGEDTTHLSVLDGDGNAVSLTTTLNTSFGCGLMVPGVGVILNNEIDDFSILADTPNAYGLVGSAANGIKPGKRPLSSMTPTVVRDGGQVVRMVLGSPGGPRIITSVLQVLLRTEVYGQSLEEAVRAPRLHQQWNPSLTRFEPGWDPLVLSGLRNRAHDVREEEGRWSSVQAIRVEVGGEPVGVSDPRRGGTADGTDLLPTEPARPGEFP